jgi:Glycosyltransferase family 87
VHLRNQSSEILRRIQGASVWVLAFMAIFGIVSIVHPIGDFCGYWTAVRLFLANRNPYGFADVAAIQRNLRWNGLPLMLMNPPWALPLLVPFGWMNFYFAWSLWTILLIASLTLCSRMLLDLYSPNISLPRVSDTAFNRGLFIFSFYPVFLCLRSAQTTPFVLLGLVGFLWADKRHSPALAGLSLSLVSLKPHLVYLVLLALLLRRSWKLIVWAAAPVCLFSLLALARDPLVFAEYFRFMRSPYVAMQPSALGWVLRMPIAWSLNAHLQYLPPLAGLIWFYFYWRRSRTVWNWPERMPALITASVLTAAYGRLYDQMLLMIPVVYLFGCYIKGAARLQRLPLWTYTAVNVAQILGAMVTSPLGYLPAPIALALFLAAPNVWPYHLCERMPLDEMSIRRSPEPTELFESCDARQSG